MEAEVEAEEVTIEVRQGGDAWRSVMSTPATTSTSGAGGEGAGGGRLGAGGGRLGAEADAVLRTRARFL
jgi:hypothetical protein